MKIKVKNLGVLKQAEFMLGDLTIICGGNNSGKTYATYALFGFLDTWREHVSIDIPLESIKQLLSHGVVRIDLQQYVDNIDNIITDACHSYTKNLSKVFASTKFNFNEADFEVSINKLERKLSDKINGQIRSLDGGVVFFSTDKSEESSEIIVTSVATQLVSTTP